MDQTTKDVLAGWIGGAAGILISNPLEVLKVRLQTIPLAHTNLTITISRSPSPVHHHHHHTSTLALKYSIPPTFDTKPSSFKSSFQSHSTFNALKSLWTQEGVRFLFAGAAAPILGLAFIDSCFFATYGKCMSFFNQDRDRPLQLPCVFASGAFAGASCALLQTPIEVIKCRAQAEHLNQVTRTKLGSYAIASKIMRQSGLRGFYLGGLMTGIRDSISSGIFFTTYAIIRRLLSTDLSTTTRTEIPQIMIAGALSGTISALLPYPLDIIKTRIQVNKLSTTTTFASTPIPPTTLSQIIHQIYHEGKQHTLSTVHQTKLVRSFGHLLRSPLISSMPLVGPDIQLLRTNVLRLSVTLGGLMGFFRGLRPTLISSFVGSGITMGIFEYVFEVLGRRCDE